VELRQLFTAMAQRGASNAARLTVLRELVRELAKNDHLDVVQEILVQAFREDELLEAQAQLILTALRAGYAKDKLQSPVNDLVSRVKAVDDHSGHPSVLAVLQQYGINDVQLGIPQPVPGSNAPLPSRLAFIQQFGMQGNWDAARGVAAEQGPLAERVIGLCLVIELAPDPKSAGDALLALGIDTEASMRAIFPMLSATRALAAAGQPDMAERLAKLIADASTRDVAMAFVWQERWKASKTTASNNDIDRPTTAAAIRIGVALRCYFAARWNAYTTGDARATGEYDTWGTGELKGFGYAGLALGLQDARK
jgi:hypothetical protein